MLIKAILNGFYSPINRVTNDGRVFDRDLSKSSDLALTDGEVRDRHKWMAQKGSFMAKFGSAIVREGLVARLGKRSILHARILAPILHPDPTAVSGRSAIAESRANRTYPPKLASWNQFPAIVARFQPNGNDVDVGVRPGK